MYLCCAIHPIIVKLKIAKALVMLQVFISAVVTVRCPASVRTNNTKKGTTVLKNFTYTMMFTIFRQVGIPLILRFLEIRQHIFITPSRVAE